MRPHRTSASMVCISMLLSVLISFCGVMCLNEAFELGSDPLRLLTVCGVAALTAVLSCLPKRGWPIALLAAIVYLGMLIWKHDLFLDSLESMLHSVTMQYAMAFDAVRVVEQASGDPFWVLMAAAIPLAWLTAWVTGREGSILLVILVNAPIFVAVLAVVDLAPVLWLIVLTGGLLIMVVSTSVRERSRTEGSILAWWLVLPTIILVCAITVLWPPVDYVRADWSQLLQDLTQSEDARPALPSVLPESKARWSRELKTVNLKSLGPKRMTGQPVLNYRSDVPVSYLRGVSLAVYEDNSWNALSTDLYQDYAISGNPQLNSAVMIHKLEVETLSRHPQLYTTYYLAAAPDHSAPVDDAYMANTDRLTAYRVSFEPALQYPSGTSEEADRLASEVYTAVPEELRQPLLDILAAQGLMDGTVEQIIEFVRNSGVYDLNTPGIPAGEDFVLYFLQESNRGYCVHFSSAAVMLLRSVGVPARYVTGYALSGIPGQWNTVTEDDAHAWVEYYTAGIGWKPLDPTPSEDSTVPYEPGLPESDPAEPVPDANEPEPVPELVHPQPVPSQAEKTGGRMMWVVLLFTAVLLMLLRRWMILYYRRRQCEKGHPNRRTMAYWNRLVQLSKASGETIEEELVCLAEKARFSQHTMEEAEIGLLRQAVEHRIHVLRSAPFLKKLWHRVGPVLY